MFPPVFQRLKQSTAVTSIVGTNPPRIYRHGNAPQPAPDETAARQAYITWFMFGAPENQLSGPPPMDRQTVQIDLWHPTDKGIVDLAVAVRNAIEPYAHMTSQPIDERDPETKLFRIAQVFDWFVSR